jgi:DNA-binding GntR family transcriptional regulator
MRSTAPFTLAAGRQAGDRMKPWLSLIGSSSPNGANTVLTKRASERLAGLDSGGRERYRPDCAPVYKMIAALDGRPSLQLKATTLRAEAFHAIRRDILGGRLAPGTKLVEADLAARLGVSRNPVREAIARLEQQGLVVSIPNRGTFIAQPTPDQALDMFMLRAHLEHLGLRLAYAHWSADTFASVADVAGDMARFVECAGELDDDVWGDFSLLDTEFHTRLVQASGSTALLRAWETAAPTDMIFLYDRMRTVEFSRSELRGMAARHQTLIDVLQGGEERAAQAELRRHFMAASRADTIALDESRLALLGWDQEAYSTRER